VAEQVIVISRNPIAREGLCRIISDSQLSVTAAVPAVEEVDWDLRPEDMLAIVDSGAHEEQISAVEDVMTNCPEARCVVLAEEFHMETMLACFDRKAHGYLVKDMPCTPLLVSLRLVSLGERVLPSSLIDVLARQPTPLQDFGESALGTKEANLSRREMDVLCCLMAGYSNKLIARQLDLSEATVKVHVKAILRKLKVGNRTQAAMWGTARRVSGPTTSQLMSG
jgi:two-component system, NarL family, nitrate/nitrite response regulator NarL